MAKGAEAKKQIFETLLKTFDGSFMYNNGKELRVNVEEESGPVQIKITLTAAKEAVSPEGEILKVVKKKEAQETVVDNTPIITEPTAEEKQNVEDLLKSLGLN